MMHPRLISKVSAHIRGSSALAFLCIHVIRGPENVASL